MEYKTPGVYIKEIPKLPPSIAQVETAIPAFIGYTEKAIDDRGNTLLKEPKRITSLLEYERFFGMPFSETGLVVNITGDANNPTSVLARILDRSNFNMHYALQMYFANGGGPCWIVSVGDYTNPQLVFSDLEEGLDSTEKVDEITLYAYPDSQGMDNADDFYNLFGATMNMCVKLKDRFAVMDIWEEPGETDFLSNIELMRDKTSPEESIIKYGATYFPNLETILDYYYGGEGSGDANVTIDHQGGDGSLSGTLSNLKSLNNALYFHAQQAIRNFPLEMPPTPGVLGVYARVDESRGVWKAPANVNLDYVIRPVIKITDEQQENLNVDVNAGKSVNVIRSFVGRGNSLIWGARTLAGNSNEWRYVPVRRFFNMVEESVKKATIQFVFEPNDRNTWTRVKAMIDNFLIQQWRAGALMGTTPEQAFYVKIGLNETMDEVDIWEGRMIVEIGMAVVRPAEFIILKFSHKMLAE
ncbi:phage tail sheath family protein [Autumnicola psychrophila]|uniref:Phage tail sheath C-terminal domain-containing protein n=1 Tax=Autumnicola psychrophila TaxID=3075592 RepID=A0ABU3DTM4_9FLAO|nr:phage tail sheath C-terminal domain-containing protein [Zunongwangia sp. F225]MDT0686998.1 phage tail sheath C-terminal domain-containing protein [Zunongwangia sp. F225]